MNLLKDFLNDGTAALIVSEEGRRYLTSFPSSLGYLFVTNKDAVLFVDGRYIIAAKQSAKNCRVELLADLFEQLKELIKQSGTDTVLLETVITVRESEHLKKQLTGVKTELSEELQLYIEGLRAVKTEYEVENIVKAQRIAEKAFDEVLSVIKPGVSEKDIAAELVYKMSRLGSEKESFETIVVSGKKSAMPHGVPDGKLIENGDFVTMDFGAVVNGYHSDMTRTVAVGFVTDEMKKVYETVLKANQAVTETAKSGITGKELDRAARSVIEQNGYGRYFTHSLGHSVGLLIHEAPNASPKSSAVLKSGTVITDEPGIYIEGKFGVRIEDMLKITDTGCENLTLSPKNLIIL